MITKDDIKNKQQLIYKITNNINKKCYIGQTARTLYKRYNGVKINRVDNEPLKRAYKKYGKENFIIEILEFDVPLDLLNDREKFYIKKFNCMAPNGYNLTEGGDNGGKRAEELINRMKISQRNIRRKNYTLMKDGVEYRFSSIAEFAELHGLNRHVLAALLKRKCRSHKKFHHPDIDIRFKRATDKIKILEKDGKTYEVYNVMRFAIEHGLSEDCLYKILAGDGREHKGFHVPDLPPPKPRKQMGPKKFSKIILIKNSDLLEVPNENRLKFLKDTKIDLYSLLIGRRKISQGYSIHELYDTNGQKITSI
jgi:group I intron endonuclease